jgi:autotransporter-associated beta strand protein
VPENTGLIGTGTVLGPVTVLGRGGVGPAGSAGTLKLTSLSAKSDVYGYASYLAFDFSASGNGLLSVAGSNGLTLGPWSVGVELLAEGTAGAWGGLDLFRGLGTYRLLKYNGAIGGSGIAALTVTTADPTHNYTFTTSIDPGYVDVVIEAAGAKWSSGGGYWTNRANWYGRAPVDGDDVYFGALPNGTSPTPYNDFPVDKPLHSITFSADASLDTSFCQYYFNSAIKGNRIRLTAGTSAIPPSLTNKTFVLQEVALPLALDSVANFNAPAGDMLVSGSVSDASGGTGGINKTGAARVILSGANTFSGPTTVSAGTLLVNGSLSSSTAAVTVGSGAALGGSGTISRPVTTAPGSYLLPGDRTWIGTLTLQTPGTPLALTGTLAIDLVFDTCDVLDAGQIGTGPLDITNEAVNFNLRSALDAPAYVFCKYTSLTGTFSSVDNLPDGYAIDYGYMGSQIALVEVPEPSTLALLATAVAGMLAFAWRRKRAA